MEWLRGSVHSKRRSRPLCWPRSMRRSRLIGWQRLTLRLMPPAMPPGVVALAGNRDVTLSWTTLPGLAYRVLWSPSEALDQTVVVSGTQGVVGIFGGFAFGK